MIEVGVVGCGYWGPNLIRNLTRASGCRVRAVADRREERRAYVRDNFPGVAAVSDHAALLADTAIDAAVIATEPRTHYALAAEFIETGRSVLVEKPLAMSAAEAEDLVRRAERRGVALMVGHTFEFNPAVRALKRYLAGGEVGEIYYLYSHRLNLGVVRREVNALWNLAPHDISILIHLLGMEPVAVSACGVAYLQQGIEDVVFVNLAFPGKVAAHVHVSWLDPNKVRRMTVVGSRKMIVYDDVAEAKLRIYDKGITRTGPADPVRQPDDFAAFQLVQRAGDVLLPHIEFTEPLLLECRHFIECVRERRRPLTDGDCGVRVVRVLEAAQRSLESGGAMVPIASGVTAQPGPSPARAAVA
jgi:predicted dehydrogenase